MLKFKEWVIQEIVNLQQAAELYELKPGVLINANYLSRKYRELAKLHHPDRGGNADVFKQAVDALELLKPYIGQKLPAYQQARQSPGVYTPRPQSNYAQELEQDIKQELTRAIEATRRANRGETFDRTLLPDAVAAVSRLVDPNTGPLRYPTINPLLKSSLEQWLTYEKQGFYNYLQTILNTAKDLPVYKT
jgi:hypothetical protein